MSRFEDVPLPEPSPELLQYLDEEYPAKSPQPHESLPALYFRGGQRALVEALHLLREKAIEERRQNSTP